jgi:hypothetical protein
VGAAFGVPYWEDFLPLFQASRELFFDRRPGEVSTIEENAKTKPHESEGRKATDL